MYNIRLAFPINILIYLYNCSVSVKANNTKNSILYNIILRARIVLYRRVWIARMTGVIDETIILCLSMYATCGCLRIYTFVLIRQIKCIWRGVRYNIGTKSRRQWQRLLTRAYHRAAALILTLSVITRRVYIIIAYTHVYCIILDVYVCI